MLSYKHMQRQWHACSRPLLSQRILAVLLVVFAPVAVMVSVACGGAVPRKLDVSMLIYGFVLSGLGVSVGYHRYFTHRSFDTSSPVAFLLGVLGSLAWQGPAIEWAEVHRRHHRHSDRPDDPHSPHACGGGLWGMIKGAIYAHQGWMFLVNIRAPDMARYSPDLRADATVRLVSRLYYLWAVSGLLLPGLIAYCVEPTLKSVWLGVLWGGIIRAFVLNHVTWCVNSICHLWGDREYDTADHSRNNPVMGIVALGEGWHNNHHAFPFSARFGLRWWQVDAGYLVIKAMKALGLVWNVRLPDGMRVSARRRVKAAD